MSVYAVGGGVECLRTYSHANAMSAGCTIVEAARATSAAPTFFEPVKITFSNGTTSTFIDGGVGFNNPAWQAVEEAHQIWPGREIGLLLSVGTGSSAPPQFRQNWLGITTEIAAARFIAKCITVSGNVNQSIRRSAEFAPEKENYFRFDVDHLGDIKLEEWKVLDEVNALTRQYMNGVERQREKTACVIKLLHLQKHEVGAMDAVPGDSPAAQALRQALIGIQNAATVRDRLRVLVVELTRQGSLDKALSVQAHVYSFLNEHYPNDHASQIYCEKEISETLSAQGKYQESATWMEKAYNKVELEFGPTNINTAIIARDLCILLLENKEKQKGLRYYNIARNFQNRLDQSGNRAAVVIGGPFFVYLSKTLFNNRLFDEGAETIRGQWRSWETSDDRARDAMMRWTEICALKCWDGDRTDLALQFGEWIIDKCTEGGRHEHPVSLQCIKMVESILRGELLLDFKEREATVLIGII